MLKIVPGDIALATAGMTVRKESAGNVHFFTTSVPGPYGGHCSYVLCSKGTRLARHKPTCLYVGPTSMRKVVHLGFVVSDVVRTGFLGRKEVAILRDESDPGISIRLAEIRDGSEFVILAPG